jgi:iron complex transport system ATP-binding protein
VSATGSDASALRCRGLSVQLGQGPVLQGVDWHLQAGRWCAVVGPNGAGKSTLLKAVAGVLPDGAALAGSVHLNERPLQAMPSQQRARALAWLSSGDDAADDLLARDIVRLGRTPHVGWWSGLASSDEAAVDKALQATGAVALQHRRIGSLSAGERQRVLLARALAVQSQVLLMDEPLSHLDPPHQADWLATVQSLKAQGVAVASVLHDLQLALMADEVLVLHQGRALAHGPASSPMVHEALQLAFANRLQILQVAVGGGADGAQARWVVFARPGGGADAQ